MPESKDEHAHKSFDLAGAVAVTAGLIALVYGIVRSAEAGWGSGEVLGFLALAAVLLVGFVVIERRSAEPLVRLSIFSVRTVRGANVAMFVVAAGLFAMFFFNTLYVQRVLGFTPLEAGLAFLPFTAGIIIGAGLSQKLVPQARRARGAASSGSSLGGRSACSSSSGSRRTASYVADLLPGIMLTSIGMGLVFVPITLIATSGVPADDAGLASGLYNTSQQIGGALGLALLSTLATNRTADELASVGRPADRGRHAPRRSSRLPRRLARRARSCSQPAACCCSCCCADGTSRRSPTAKPRPSPPGLRGCDSGPAVDDVVERPSEAERQRPGRAPLPRPAQTPPRVGG